MPLSPGPRARDVGWVHVEHRLGRVPVLDALQGVPAVHLHTREPVVPPLQELEPGALVTGKVTIRNVGNAAGSLGVILWFVEIGQALAAYPKVLEPGQTATLTIDEETAREFGLIMPSSDLHIRIEAGTVTREDYSDFVKQDEKEVVIKKATAPPPPPPEKAKITGEVRSYFGTIAGAEVEANGVKTKTNESGVYVLEVDP